jgi:hypothetical protein
MGRRGVRDNHLSEILRDLMKNSTELKNDMADFKRRCYEDPDRSKDYAYLMKMLRRHITTMKISNNNTALCQASGKAGKVTPANVVPVNERKDPCKFWELGKGCWREKECKFWHNPKNVQEQQRGTPKAKASPKGEGRGARTPSPAAVPKGQCCFRFNMDCCTKTVEDCNFEPRKVREDEQGAFESYKKFVASRSAEAKAKKVLAAVAGNEETPKLSKKAKAKANREAAAEE